MDRTKLHQYLMSKKGAGEDRPFGPDAAVYKIISKKMFALVPDDKPFSISLKCDPDEAIFLRQMYSAVKPGYHMNKHHWNTVTIDGSIPDQEIYQMIDASYNLVLKSLKKADRQALTG